MCMLINCNLSGFFLIPAPPAQAEYHNSIYYLESTKLVLEKAGHQSLVAADMITVFTSKIDCNSSVQAYNFCPILNGKWKLLPCKLLQQNAVHSSPVIFMVFICEIICNTWSTMHLCLSGHLYICLY